MGSTALQILPILLSLIREMPSSQALQKFGCTSSSRLFDLAWLAPCADLDTGLREVIKKIFAFAFLNHDQPNQQIRTEMNPTCAKSMLFTLYVALD